MNTLRRIPFATARAFALATALTLFFDSPVTPALAAASASASAPIPFAGKLDEFAGVQALVTVRHPKLILAELDKLMAEVPEAAMLRMVLPQLTPYGYPEFTEFVAGSNIGVVVLDVDPETLAARPPTIVALARMKESGKIRTMLTPAGLSFKKQGEWTVISQGAADLTAIQSSLPAIIAAIERPQTEEIKLWVRATPKLLTGLKTPAWTALQPKFATRPADEQNAIHAYFDIAWKYLEQLHSLGGSIDLNDQGIALSYHGQFLPESALGTLLRHPPGASPRIAQSVPADGLLNGAMRLNNPPFLDFFDALLDELLAVDYAAGREALAPARKSFRAVLAQSDGGAGLTVDVAMPRANQPPEMALFAAYSGTFSEEQLFAYYRDSIALSQKASEGMLAAISAATPGAPVPKMEMKFTENVFTIDGVRFGSMASKTTIPAAGAEQVSAMTQYFGVANGTMVLATSEDALRARLPAILAGRPVVNPVPSTFQNGQVLIMAVRGEKVVDLLVSQAAPNLADEDVRAQIETIKEAFASAAPPTITLEATDARAGVTYSIPYKFIAQCARLATVFTAPKTPPAPRP